MYSIYRITNLINNKKYIGITVNTIQHRFNQHAKSKTTIVGKAIHKYKRCNFKIECIHTVLEEKEALSIETKEIKANNSLVPNGYNLKLHVQGHSKHHPASIKKIRDSIIARDAYKHLMTKESREAMKIAVNTKEHKEALSIQSKNLWKDPKYRKKTATNRSDYWTIQMPSSKIVTIRNLRKFCDKYKLIYSSVKSAAKNGNFYLKKWHFFKHKRK
jgi:GIY-YIG catalytic domain